MPELYTGQAQVVAAKLEQARLLQEADNNQLEITEYLGDQAAIRRRMAGRVGLISGLEQQLVKCENGEGADAASDGDAKTKVFKIRISDAEDALLRSRASDQGMTVSQYARMMCGL